MHNFWATLSHSVRNSVQLIARGERRAHGKRNLEQTIKTKQKSTCTARTSTNDGLATSISVDQSLNHKRNVILPTKRYEKAFWWPTAGYRQ